METILISTIVGCLCLLGLSKFIQPTTQKQTEEITQTQSELDVLEQEVKAFSGVGEQISELKTDSQKVWDTLDHVQNIAENGDNFMKANEREIQSLKDALSKTGKVFDRRLDLIQDQIAKLKTPTGQSIPQPLLIKQKHEDMVLVEVFKKRAKDRSKWIKFSRWMPIEEYRKKFKSKPKRKTSVRPAVAQQ